MILLEIISQLLASLLQVQKLTTQNVPLINF
jgi:hypothetical protein